MTSLALSEPTAFTCFVRLEKLSLVDLERIANHCIAKMSMFGPNNQAQQMKLMSKQVEQLRREVKIQREKLSVCSREIVGFCEKEQRTDPLLIKIPASENPFRDRGQRCRLF